jgi:hypothetical protein
MSKEIAKDLKIILMKNDIEIEIDAEKEEKLDSVLSQLQGHTFIKVEGRRINTADMSGVYYPEDIEKAQKKRRGMWKCDKGVWHERNETCYCNRPLGR